MIVLGCWQCTLCFPQDARMISQVIYWECWQCILTLFQYMAVFLKNDVFENAGNAFHACSSARCFFIHHMTLFEMLATHSTTCLSSKSKISQVTFLEMLQCFLTFVQQVSEFFRTLMFFEDIDPTFSLSSPTLQRSFTKWFYWECWEWILMPVHDVAATLHQIITLGLLTMLSHWSTRWLQFFIKWIYWRCWQSIPPLEHSHYMNFMSPFAKVVQNFGPKRLIFSAKYSAVILLGRVFGSTVKWS